MSKKTYRIAVIPGDGIGKEVVPEGLRVLEAAAKKHGVAVHFDHFDFASYDYYAKHGEMMPEDWKAKIGKHDAIYFGAVGWPAKIPDHISLWGSLIKFRREFDQYVNLRPVRLMPGVPSPLANRKPGDIDFWVVRENTEGEFQDTIDADAAHHGLLGDEFAVGIREHPTAYGRVLAFGVFAHHPEIDVAGLAVGERRRHARHQPHRSEVDVLIEFPAELDQRSPQRNVIGNFRRPADRAEIDRVVLADLFLPVLRHHLAMLFVIVV